MSTVEKKTILAVAVGPNRDVVIDPTFVKQGRLSEVRPYIQGLIDGLKRLQHELGKDLAIVYMEREPADIDKAVAQAVTPTISLVFPMSTTALQAALKATKITPIVFPSISDPAADGVVPGGNATGVSASRTQAARAGRDRFIEMVPTLKKIYALHMSGYGPATRALQSVQSGSPVPVDALPVASRAAIHGAISNIPIGKPGEVGILVLPSDLMLSAAPTIVQDAHGRGIPTFFPISDVVKADGSGALGGYGVPQRVCGELAAAYVHLILQDGRHPRDLPVTTADRFDCVVSRQAANGMNLTIKVGAGVREI